MNGFDGTQCDRHFDSELNEYLDRDDEDCEEEELICVNMNCDYQDDNSTYCCGAERRDGEPVFPTCKMRIIEEL